MLETLQKMSSMIDIPIIEYLHSNTTLSSAESQFIQADSRILETDISSMALEIEQLQSILQRLIIRHREKSDLLSSYHALRAPIRRLPPEILGHIFFRSLPDEEFVQPDINSSPLILGTVCRYWRKISMHTPRLWTSLSIPVHLRNIDALNDLWLSRSGDYLPISLEFPYIANTGEIVRARYEHRCQRVKIPATIFTNGSFKVDADSFPSLEEITITNRASLIRTRISVSGPKIKRVELPDIDNLLYLGNLDVLPWSQLTHLKFTCYFTSLAPLASLFRCCNLEELDSTFSGHIALFFTDTTLQIPSSVVLPKLHSWTICVNLETVPEGFMDALVTPGLRKLKLSGTLFNWSKLRPQIISFISRSSCSLERIEIHVDDLGSGATFPFSADDMDELVRPCLSLPTLIVCKRVVHQATHRRWEHYY